MRGLRVAFFVIVASFAIECRSTSAQTPDMRARWLDAIAGRTYHHPDFAVIAAQLTLHRDTAFAYRQLDTLLSRPYGDMFWAMWSAGIYYATQDVLRPEYKQKIHEAWKRFTPYRGDTENHFLMYYAAWFLMTQAFPNEPGTEWFNGRSSEENYRDARDYLVHWVEETARYGLTEWDSPRYGYYYITPLVLLSEYTKDKELKERFRKTLDLILTDYAIEYLDGSYCGAHSRVSDEEARDARHNEISAYGSYFFGDSVDNVREDVAFAALSHYECPKIIRDIARDRSKPYELYERRRGRRTIRHSSEPYAPVYKYTYMTDKFCLGSIQGGIVQPIQQQSWSLVINQDSTPNVMTGLNPHFDSAELTMFFPEYPQFMMERIGAVKQGYPNENKWVGGSPYEHIYQDKNLLVAMYDLPDSARYHHVDLFIPATLRLFDTASILQPDWIVVTTSNRVRVAIHPNAPYRLTREANGVRLRMSASHSGYAIYCGDATKIHLLAFNRKVAKLDIHPKRMTARPPGGEWLYYSPHVKSKLGSGIIALTHGKDRLVLDYTK